MKKVYSMNNVKLYIEKIKPFFKNVVTESKNKSKVEYFNIPCSFDIETSSFYDSNGKKTAIMYEWSFAIYDYVIIGREWKEFTILILRLVYAFNININRRLIVYVHNLSYEFQFMKKRFHWEKVFGIENRKPLYALAKIGVMFKCSYYLSSYNLAKLADNLTTHKIRKLVGDLDYSKIRHPETPLTVREIMYCINDVRIVTAYIQEQIEYNDNCIYKIPLTSTGYVRRYTRNNCLYVSKSHKKGRTNYSKIISRLKINDITEYKMLKMAFMGGFTHANHNRVGGVYDDVSSYDFTSSYPAVMLSEKFPMGKGHLVRDIDKKNSSQLEMLMKTYCCVFHVTFYEIMATFDSEHYISESRCLHTISKNIESENGRVYYAEVLSMIITEVDFEIISKTYKWKCCGFGKFYCYMKDYLPKELIESVIELYHKKNTLKHVKGKEVEYMKSKQMLNSTYGMIVTDISRDLYEYINEWFTIIADTKENIEKYNKSFSRFLYYPWGIFVTAYARRNLWSGILECGDDYIYSDTDSIKILNKEKHVEYINNYNKLIEYKLRKMCNSRKIEFESLKPKGILLGTWDYEGDYNKFKTLGAKRYMYTKDGKNNLTVSGLNKNYAIPYLENKYGKEHIYEEFTDDMYIPKGHTGKNTHTYIDDTRKGSIKDYLGNTYKYIELSSVHLEESDFTLNMTVNYLNYIFKNKESNYYSSQLEKIRRKIKKD